MRRSVVVVATAMVAATALAAVASRPSPASRGGKHAPTYASYPIPDTMSTGAGEPSIGANWKSGAVLFQAYQHTLKVGFDDTSVPATATWKDVTYPPAVTTLDPILWTDSASGHTITSQLVLACSVAGVTTNDGATWLPSQGCGVSLLQDHQSVGGGPYHAPLALASDKVQGRLAVYYCGQHNFSNTSVDNFATCARSDNGGLTFGPGVPIYNVPVFDSTPSQRGPAPCAGLHGHVKVGPDGTVYVPNFDCGKRAGVSVSEDNGLTWTIYTVPGSTTQDESDPSLGIGADGTLYLGWQDGGSTKVGSTAKVAISHDRGRTWTRPVDVGAPFRIKNVQFPELVAGDSDRAAYAFIGTPTAGDDQRGGQASNLAASKTFAGVWHLYIATTYNGGRTWTTVDATPNDPVQRGCVWLQGGGGGCRNLLDFNDITVDKQGRVLVAYAKGCVRTCVHHPLAADDVPDSPKLAGDYRSDHGVILRQQTGRGLFRAYDHLFASP